MNNKTVPLSAMFLGPKAENANLWSRMIQDIFTDYVYWRRNYFPNDPIVLNLAKNRENDEWAEEFSIKLQSTLNALKAHFPFYSPRYMAHMLSEQTLPAVLGYFSGMLYNPNNVTDEAAPVTVELEIEFGKMICKMLGYGRRSWAHICSGGTVANIEALWVARQVQFLPLIIQEFCAINKITPEFEIKLPNSTVGETTFIKHILKPAMLSLKPNDAISMLQELLNHLVDSCNYTRENAHSAFNDFISQSLYSVKHRGFHSVIKSVGLEPVIFVPESSHYSFKKAVNLLGYGENSIRFIPLNHKFRIDINKLEKLLLSMKKNEYIAAVIAVAGTTEEGAVDPIHEVKFLRDKLEKERNRSFWFHVDAAWGGYMRTLFSFDGADDIKGENLDDLARKYIDKMNIREDFSRNVVFEWSDPEVIKAFLAIKSADSITIDPHKMGFVPYPAGVIAFKNNLVAQFVAQKAQYISDSSDSVSLDVSEIREVGPYIIEGSKPGAIAVSCWLAATSIPLDLRNHGKIVKTSILNTIRLKYYLTRHQGSTFYDIEEARGNDLPRLPFKFVPLYDNIDTNVLCFVVVPMKWRDGTQSNSRPKMVAEKWRLSDLNSFNEDIYSHFTLSDNHKSSNHNIHIQSFFLSRTRVEKDQYAYASIEKALRNIGRITQSEYEKNGLFVLRSSIMNPWHYTALTNNPGMDYFMEFIKELHKVARTLLNDTNKHPASKSPY